MKNYLIALTILLTATGCATMNEDECLTADWWLIGFEDGAIGQPADYIGKHREACARFSVAPELNEYLSGRDEGLGQYCVETNGFQIGRSGGSYQGACVDHDEPGFLSAYQDGRQLGDLEREVQFTTSELSQARTRLRDLDEYISDTNANLAEQLTDVSVPKEQREHLLNEVRAKEQERGTLLERIPRLEAERAVLALELAQLKETIRYL